MKGKTKARLLVIGAGFLQGFVIRRARDLGLTVVAVDRDSDAVGFRWAHTTDVVDIKDGEACLAVAKRENVDAVLSVSTDFAVRTVAFVTEALGLPGLSSEAARVCTNKALMRRALEGEQIGRVAFGVASSPEKATEVAVDIGFPCILKPVDSVGSRGVSKVEGALQVVDAFETASRVSASGETIIEELIEGPEVSVEAVTVDGETKIAAVTDKMTSGPPHFVEVGHTQPSAFSGEETIRETVERCVRALGIDCSATHTELRLTRDGIAVMEVGARLGGDRITSDLVPLSTGIDLMESVIMLALGEKPDAMPRWDKGSAIRYALVPPGPVTKVTGIETARSVKGVADVLVGVSVGDTVPELRSSGDRVAHVVAQGSGALEASAAAEDALSKLRIEVTT
jgi:biotin carboxylase